MDEETDLCQCGHPAQATVAGGGRWCYDCLSDGEQIVSELWRQETRAILLGVLAAVGWALFFGSVIAMGIK